MLNRIFLISNDYSLISNLPADSNVFFSLVVNPAESSDLKAAYRYFSLSSKNNFSLSLEIKIPLAYETIRSVISFLFLPPYLQIDRSFIVNLIGPSESLLEETAKSLSSCSSEHGIEDISINIISLQKERHNKKGNKLFNSAEILILEYDSILRSDYYFDNNIFLFSPSMPDVKSVSTSLLEIEKSFEKQNPKLFLLACDIRRLKKEKRIIEIKYQLAENELNNQKEYADMLRATHTTRQLQDFYNNEYEVLPKWYKQFGHIIKVIMGKRTFKSLFNDNIKKHND